MSGRDSLDDVPTRPGMMTAQSTESVVKVDLRIAAAVSLAVLHEEFVKASKLLDQVHNGPTRNADQRIELIATYGEAVERIIRSVSETTKEES